MWDYFVVVFSFVCVSFVSFWCWSWPIFELGFPPSPRPSIVMPLKSHLTSQKTIFKIWKNFCLNLLHRCLHCFSMFHSECSASSTVNIHIWYKWEYLISRFSNVFVSKMTPVFLPLIFFLSVFLDKNKHRFVYFILFALFSVCFFLKSHSKIYLSILFLFYLVNFNFCFHLQ